MRRELESHGSLSLESLLRFNSIKSISTDKELLKAAAQSGELRELIVLEEKDGAESSIRRKVPFDFKTMGDGSSLSLYVKNIPVNEKPPAVVGDDEKKEGGDENTGDGDGRNGKAFRPTYAVTRDEVKVLFERYGRVGIVNLRFGPRREDGDKDDDKYVSPNQRGYRRGESIPLGAAIVEFDSMEGMEKACADLLPPPSSENDETEDKTSEERGEGEGDADKKDNDEGEKKETKEPKTVLELKGNKLRVEKMKPLRRFADDRKNNKRKHDDSDGNKSNSNGKEAPIEEEPIQFNEFKLDWKKGCVIALTGLSAEKCSREAMREAVSDILGVSKDVKISGLYVDYTRGADKGNLRLKEPKGNEMKELVEKLNDGSVVIDGEKVGCAKILEGEEEEKYYADFIAFMNNRNKQRAEEKQQAKKQKFGHGRGGKRR